jgi:hypothetical protein
MTAVLAEARSAAVGADLRAGAGLGSAIQHACRRRARPHLGTLGESLPVGAGWDDLILPSSAIEALRGIIREVRHRDLVHHDWGFAGHHGAGGVSALFSGPSGTGKTMAAAVIAKELGLDLFRIDLSAVVSKYIGETEKNLSRIFDVARDGAAVLLFDEADALFGKRSDVRDSHDRFANIQVSYLLARMDSFDGLAILTTNQAGALDPAFHRRLRFMVRFPFPDAGDRARIWQRAFPSRTPLSGVDLERLAGLEISGAGIRNIALGAAFRAAEQGRPIQLEHLRAAALAECAKSERQVSPVELSGWG